MICDSTWTLTDGIGATCMLLSAALCTWAVLHLVGAGSSLWRRFFRVQILALSATDLVSTMMHAAVYAIWFIATREKTQDLISPLYWDMLNFMDFSSCFLEVQIAAGFAAASAGSWRLTSMLRWTLPLGFVAAGLLAVISRHLHGQNSHTAIGVLAGVCITEHLDAVNTLWSVVALSCCSLIVLFCLYGILKSSAAPGPIRRRGLLRGVSYVACALVTWIPFATVVNLQTDITWGWFTAKSLALYALRFNGAANVSAYIFWAWRARRLQEFSDAERRRMDYESLVLDTYFDAPGTHMTEANRLTGQNVATAGLVEEGLEKVGR